MASGEMHRKVPRLALCAALLVLLGAGAAARAQKVRARPAKKVKKAPAKRKATSAEKMRERVGLRAAQRVRSGQVVGLGTGRTANEVIRALGRRVRKEGLEITGVATSERTARLAKKHGIPVVHPKKVRKVDVAIDGADEVDPELDLVKGLGGALLREKKVARKADHFIVVVDQGKMVSSLGGGKLPVEVNRKVAEVAVVGLRALGARASVRLGESGKPYVTDNGNHIVDLELGSRARKKLGTRRGRKRMAKKISKVPGVIDHGLFLGMTREVLVGREDGSVESIQAGD